MTNWEWALHNPEGQSLERKSCYNRSGGRLWRRRGDTARVREIEAEIDGLAAELWGLTEGELQEIRESLEELG